MSQHEPVLVDVSVPLAFRFMERGIVKDWTSALSNYWGFFP